MGTTEPLGIVFSTGFNTFKGNLIAGILYPKKTKINLHVILSNILLLWV